ncbi:uncharacterized protein [Physcomitrium patens]|uniref:Uncharacterized protein n=1 Tax=Physcomitrium patens TaxID=3218 RepID=A0A7I4EMF4_PHYPA|nr:uncharacterized protein LOC112287032 [Physcomitrium patens]|eukprot:XP_024385400.1 uncharacterized protein LOC112287032 [Physcomitrella patens]
MKSPEALQPSQASLPPSVGCCCSPRPSSCSHNSSVADMEDSKEYLQNTFRNAPPPPTPPDELPGVKIEWNFRLQKTIDMVTLQTDLDMVSDKWPDQFLQEPKVVKDRDDNNVIVITGYPPHHNYDVQGVLVVVRKHDPAAVVI